MKVKLSTLLFVFAVFSCSPKKEKVLPQSPRPEAIETLPKADSAIIQVHPENQQEMNAVTAPNVRYFMSVSDEPQIFENNIDPDEAWWDAHEMNLNTAVKKPKWSDMEKWYPRKRNDGSNESKEIFNLVGGAVAGIYNSDPEGSINTCALRMSIALNKSGVSIPYKKEHTFQGKDGRYYFLSAAKIFHWSMENFGKPDLYFEDPNGFEWNNNLDQAIKGKNGIYIIQAKSPKIFGATGHADLFNGDECLSGHCYFNPQGGAIRVAFWALKD